MKHTPGPWHRNIRANGKYPVVFAGRNQHVATVCQQANTQETELNIDLIASAPELLCALDQLIRVTIDEDLKGGFTLSDPVHAAYTEALRVIEKATGGRHA